MSSSCFCQTKRAKTMADAYKANYEYMLQSPLMQELYNKNKKLERENLALVRVIIRLSNDLEKQGSTIKATKRSNFQTANIDEPADDDVSALSTSNAEMTEPIIVHKLDANNDANNDANYHSPNIVYELEEEEDDEDEGCEEEAETEVVEEAEEEEEEAEEEEGNEAEEEEGNEAEEGNEVDEEEGNEGEEEGNEGEEEAEVEVEGEEEDCEVVEEGEEEDCEVEGEEEEDCEVEAEEEEAACEVEEVEEEADEILEEETEVVEITIRGKKYFTTNTTNGEIYAMDANGDVGDEVGQFVNGSAKFNKK